MPHTAYKYPAANRPVRNIVFDLGNVIINIDPDLTVRSFEELGAANFGEMYGIMRQAEIFDRLDTGKIALPEFRQAIRDFTGTSIADGLIDDAWCAMLLDFPYENAELLRKLRIAGYRLYLLSNTNEIHIDRYVKRLQLRFGRNLLAELFDRIFYSHEIGFRKPDREAFEYALKAERLNPAETLFIDDLEHNVESARQTGMLACRHRKGDRLSDLFAL